MFLKKGDLVYDKIYDSYYKLESCSEKSHTGYAVFLKLCKKDILQVDYISYVLALIPWRNVKTLEKVSITKENYILRLSNNSAES